LVGSSTARPTGEVMLVASSWQPAARGIQAGGWFRRRCFLRRLLSVWSSGTGSQLAVQRGQRNTTGIQKTRVALLSEALMPPPCVRHRDRSPPAHRQPDSRNQTRTCASAASALCSALPCPTSTCMSASIDSFFPSSSRPFLACPPRGLYISLVPHLISIHHHHLRSISSAACATLPFTSHRNILHIPALDTYILFY
jgi:hypothetical protein